MNEPTRPQNSGYGEAGASLSRRALRGFQPNSGSPREDIYPHLRTLRGRSRLLALSSPVATAAINTNRTHVVGVGLTLQCSIDRNVLRLSEEAAKEWQRKAEAEFRLWADTAWNCDAIGLNNFASLQQLALKSWLTSGDVFPLIKWEAPTPLNPYGLRIHLIEADRVSTPTILGTGSVLAGSTAVEIPQGQPGAGNHIYDGVEVDSAGRVAAYHICSRFPGETAILTDERSWTRVPVRGEKTGIPNILHVMDSERPDQYRGVPYLAPVIEMLAQLRRYTESELMASLIQSFFTAWIQTESDPSAIPINVVGDGTPGSEMAAQDNEREVEYEMGPGLVLHLKPGEKVEFGNPNVPTAGFQVFVETVAKLIGAGLELPYDVLIKEFNSSYSASRGALMEAWEAFKMRRKWFVDAFCQPIYEIWLAEAVARGRIKAPGFFDDPLLRKAWCGASWVGPVQIQLDPVKEAKAAVIATGHAFRTHKHVTREMGGGDWDQNIEQIKRENAQLTEAGCMLAD